MGPAGFSYPDWDNLVYPISKPRNFDKLTYLAQYVDIIEINSTFYNPLKPAVFKKWLTNLNNSPKVSPEFTFTIKLWQKFTHDQNGFDASDIKTFKASIKPLAENNKISALLIQFPYSFHRTAENMNHLEIILKNFGEYPRAVEMRHNSWNHQEYLRFLEDHDIAFVNIDQPMVGRSLGITEYHTSKLGYIRLHGRNHENWFRENSAPGDRYDYLYSDRELLPWYEIILKLKEQVEQLLVITNNHFKGKALVNILQLKFKLVNEPIRVPEELKRYYPKLKDIALQEGQLSLF